MRTGWPPHNRAYDVVKDTWVGHTIFQDFEKYFKNNETLLENLEISLFGSKETRNFDNYL
jgi:hypothetical protein